MRLYILIQGAGTVVGIFNSFKKLKIVVEEYVKDSYETSGVYGNFHFQYAIFNVNEPYFVTSDNEEDVNEANAIFTLSTIRPEMFKHKIINDFSTGKILNWDSK